MSCHSNSAPSRRAPSAFLMVARRVETLLPDAERAATLFH
jgi:hypothetical protein